MEEKKIILRKVKVHNLKSVDLTLDPFQLIVFTGVSGSGKSSLAFDTIFVEGQRRYIESLSTYARRHLGELPKPDAELISGISPSIAIEQKTAGKNPRSTVGTMTSVYDFMRVLYARVGIAYCPVSGERVTPQSAQAIIHKIRSYPKGARIILLSPYAQGKKGEFKDDFADLLRQGFMRVRLDGKIIELSDQISVAGTVAHDVDIVIDRITVEEENFPRLTEAVTMALDKGKGILSVLNADTGEEELFSEHAYSKKSGLSYPPLQPHDFSFNHPSGMCPTCQGLGLLQEFDVDKIIDPELSIAEDCCIIGSSYTTVRYGNIFDNLARLYNFSVNTPWKKLSDKAKHVFLYGTEKKWTEMRFVHPEKKTRWTEYVQWRGVLHEAKDRLTKATSDSYRAKMSSLFTEMICPSCQGARIRAYPAATLLGGKRIHEITAMSIQEAHDFLKNLKLSHSEKFIAEELLKEIGERLEFLVDVGLHYLTLERTSPTLSGGESQRVRLSSQIGSGLVGTTYVLDEPSIGLHPRDNTKLLGTLRKLRDKGNTVIVVEHDEETIAAADEIVDVGPLAGRNGGRIVAQGSLKDIEKSPESLTGAYLSGKLSIKIPKKRRTASEFLHLENATLHNLQNVSVKFPLKVFIGVSGVSGSGKSSLVSDTLYPILANKLNEAQMTGGPYKKLTGLEELDKVIAVDQTPIGRTPRSNPSTYIKLFDDIRDLFTMLPESQAAGFKAGRFSFNVKEGSCPYCSGMGMTKIDMDFMEDEWVTCAHCKGKRFDEKTLSIRYKGKNIHDVLEMTVLEATEFFSAIPYIHRKLETLMKVGLDYIQLGQPSPTLSGGEAQRIKLAKELTRPSTGKTFYILDEPTTGLHFHDIQKLVTILQELVDRGNTVLVIEHNFDLMKTVDWIIDLGPEGGSGGGKIVAEGKPEKIAKLKTPTGTAMQKALFPQRLVEHKKPRKITLADTEIIVKGACQNNLKNIDVAIPREKITVCTGPSGSGKSSFAFETVYAEGQRRYTESLSPYARQFIKQMPKPKVDKIDGLSASIAIEQKNHAGNPRSTLGTMTEIYDYLRILYAMLGIPYEPDTGERIETISVSFVLEKLMQLPENTPLYILSPLILRKHETFDELKDKLQKSGFLRIRLNGEYYELDQTIPFDAKRKNEIFLVIDRLTVKAEARSRLFEAVSQGTSMSGGTMVAATKKDDFFFNLAFASPKTGKSYPPITPHTFSFNTEAGMCLECQGLGFQYGANLTEHKEIMKLSVLGLMKLLWKDDASDFALDLFQELLKSEKINPKDKLNELPAAKLQILFTGSQKWVEKRKLRARWIGLNSLFAKAAKSHNSEVREALIPLLHQVVCHSCKGARLNPLARHVELNKLTIASLCNLSLDDAFAFINKIKLMKKEELFLEETLRQLRDRLQFLISIGLGYLALERSAPTLSGGETQRVRLARQLGTGLTGCLYVLDEPTIGLHPHDNYQLNDALRKLCSMGNTLLLVEHDPLTINASDYLIDFGPGAGKEGGRIMAQGTIPEIKKNPKSLTGAYLSGKKKVPYPDKRRTSEEFITIKNASLHNLKGFDVDFPIGVFNCITGVSGSGKSTLLHDLVKPEVQKHLTRYDKLLILDQSPIGHTNRADVCTYVDLLTPLRYFFAQLPVAKARGLMPKNFSFNHRKGMCTTCWGLGHRTISLQFLPSIKVVCDQCHGYRLNPLSLQVHYHNKHLGHILHMTVKEAKTFLPPIPKIERIIDTLIAVGLDYLTLGQEIATLSGGEAQRLRLSRELAKRATGRTTYLLDEPTIGLHSEDILKLLTIFHALVAKGHTLILIEHNLDIISNADYVVDLGPGPGKNGGKLVAVGTPEEIMKNKNSITGKYLKDHLK